MATPLAAQSPAELNTVKYSYHDHLALEALTLALRAGEITALLGPNGAGKTTAVRLVLGLLSPQSGTVSVFGGDPREPRTRVQVGTMLQVGRAPDTLRVREHIESFRSYYPAPMDYAEVVRIAQVATIQERLFGELSGGQKQRVLFALAICGNANLLVLDEPTVGLDIESRRTMWEQIGSLKRCGKSVLLTTHYLEEADNLASRIVVLQKGRVIGDGTPAEIKRRASLAAIECRTTLTQSALSTIPGVVGVKVEGSTATLQVRCTEDVLRALFSLDPAISDLRVNEQKLEDAFLALTREEAAV